MGVSDIPRDRRSCFQDFDSTAVGDSGYGLGRCCQEELARAAHGTFQILAPMGAVNVSSITFPVFKTPAGSNTITSASSSAAVRCSTPRGTTTNSPGPNSTFLSRNSTRKRPRQTKNNSSTSLWWCHGKVPCTLISLTSWPFSSATILGCHCSENRVNFSAMFIRSISSPLARGIQNIILQKPHERDAVSGLRPMMWSCTEAEARGQSFGGARFKTELPPPLDHPLKLREAHRSGLQGQAVGSAKI